MSTDDSNSIASYLPALLVRRFMADVTPLSAPVSEDFDAAIFFADISGFTTLAEQLAERSPAGAEELSALLKDYFGQLIELVTAHGGDIVKFAGDALLALWPAGDGEDLSIATRRAAQCGLAVQAKLDHYETAQGSRLSLRVGIGAGKVRAIYVGGVYQRWELMVTGKPLVEMSLAEQQAQPGEVVLSAAAWEQVQDQGRGQKLPSGDIRLEAIHTPLPLRALLQPDIPPEATKVLQAYLPGAILARLNAGQSDWLAELRNVTVIFVSLPGLNHATPLDEAQAVMQALQKNIYRYEGSINKLNVDDKGVTLLAVLGLPPWSHEDDAVRGVQAARDIRETLHALGWRSAIGVASGRTFCGSVGNEQRREYTLLGDMVNLAARLMQAASAGQDILCDAVTYRAASARLAFETLPPIMVKGKAEPVSVYRPSQAPTAGQGQSQAPGNLTPMVGREKERAALDSALQALQDGASRLVMIEGEAGIGKSRLVAELLGLAQARGVSVLSGAGDGIEKSTPYHAWRPVFSQLFSLDPLSKAEQQRAQALAQLESAPEALRLAPLLNAVLPLDIPENELTAQMTGQVRADNTRDLLLGLLQTAASRSSTLLVLEDVHWLDSASWALALAVAQQVRPLMLVLATRPLSTPLPLEYNLLLGLPSAQLLQLEVLPPEELLSLVCQRLGVASLPDEVIQLIQEKAEGHPFFSEELAYALRDAGLITIANGECHVAPNVDLRSLSFPETVQGVITSRIDRLTPQQQLALKAASVIGRVFALRILRHVHPIEADRPRLAEYLAGMQRLDITPLETPAPDEAYIFKHAITQDVAYNLMLFSQRRELHQHVAEWYEQTFASDLDPYYPLLAHHWSRAIEGLQHPEPALVEKALSSLEKAGEAALHGYANQEAIGFFSAALRLEAEQRVGPAPSPALRRARWERHLAEADLRMGFLSESGEHFRRALALLGLPAPQPNIQATISLLGQFMMQVLHRRWPARFMGKERDQSVVFLEAAGAYLRLGESYYYTNQVIPAIGTAFRAVNLAESVGTDSPEMARAYANICFSAALLGLRGPAESYSRLALNAARGQDDLPALAHVLIVTSIYKSHIAHWDETLPAVEQAAAINERLGERRWWGEDLLLLGLTAYYRGEFARGLQRTAEAYALSRQTNNIQQQPWHLLGQAQGLIRLGRTDEAVPMLEEALVISDVDTDLRVKANSYGLLALARLHRGEPELARAAAAQAAQWIAKATTDVTYMLEGYADTAEVTLALWEAAAAQGQPTSELCAEAGRACKAMHKFARIYPIGQPRDLLWQGLYDWLDGKPARAQERWQKSLERAVQLSMRYDEALAHREIGRHLPAADPAHHEHLSRAKEIFAELGAGYDLERMDE
jgi:predicted ATPase/class 3 adenylate cyclase